MILPDIQYTPSQSESIPNFLLKAMAQKREEDRAAADLLLRRKSAESDERRVRSVEERQARLDREEAQRNRGLAVEEIRQHLMNDDPESAQIAASKYGMQLGQQGPQAPLPPMPTGRPSGLMGEPPISAPPLPAMPPQGMAGPRPGMMPPGGQPPMGGGIQQPQAPQALQAAEPTFQDRQQAETDAHLQALLEHPNHVAQTVDAVDAMKQARQASQQQQQAPQGASVYRLLGPEGESLAQFDTGGMRARREQGKADLLTQIQQAYGADSETYKRATAMATLGQSRDSIVKAINSIDQERAKFEGRKTIEQMQEDAGKYKRHGRGGGGSGAGTGDGFNPKIDLANTRSLKEVDSETTRWAHTSGLDALRRSREELDHVKEQIASGNPMAAASALEKLTSVSRGGAASQGALALMQKHLSGSYGSLEGLMARLSSGDFGPEQRKNLMGAVEAMQGALDKGIADKHEEFVKGFYTPGRYNQKGNIEDREEQMFGSLGMHPRYDPEAPTIVPGSGKLPGKTRSGRTSEPAANPLTSAANQGAMSPADKALAAKARATKPGDPLYDSAQRWLKAHKL